MDGLVFFKEGKSLRVSDKTPLPVDIGGNITVDVSNITVDQTPVVNKLNELKALLEQIESGIDSQPSISAPDLKTRVTQVRDVVEDLRTTVDGLLTITTTHLENISDYLNKNGLGSGDVFGRLDTTNTSLSLANTNLSNILSRLQTITNILDDPGGSSDIRGVLDNLYTLTQSIRSQMDTLQRRIEDASIGIRYWTYYNSVGVLTGLNPINFSSGQTLFIRTVNNATAIVLTTNSFGENVYGYERYQASEFLDITVLPNTEPPPGHQGIFVRVFGWLEGNTVSTLQYDPSIGKFRNPDSSINEDVSRRFVHLGTFPDEGRYSRLIKVTVPCNYIFRGFRFDFVRSDTSFGDYNFFVWGHVR
ncbi:MAG: hypothetical protein KatS3mg087_0457 [Patescibacteria group bacterium]|nr:MAG: hypothetical protein KatS3mg087_0457 [Patescibacteria group bacterium]